ncbi:hypothetical protein [Rhodopirellula sp. P2]|uniref:hypothetical protein n=1 Tax=Rhodopirellula sp. P2 TaxID=2127060 RepID=UPI002368A2BA|nr:hypothetical protein [Rhodopirellula sp. P2]WDQ15418.1 hypothetical protein PSR62_17450 [Rhodopirellula sp. P2]
MRFTTRNLLAVPTVLAICCASGVLGWSWITRKGVELHQHAVTRELTEWGKEYTEINDDASAIRAAEMIAYIRTYYVPRHGYRGSEETERELEIARDTSLRSIIDALERYTGHEFGGDYLAWSRWADSKKQPSGEP